jgi:hypothetical protein
MRRLRSAPVIAIIAILAAAPAAVLAYPRPPAPLVFRKTISDTAEYNAYMAAQNTTDAAARAAALEAFTAAYPASVLHREVLEQTMAAWQQAGDMAKLEDAARKLVEAEPDSVRALAILAAFERSRAVTEADPAEAHRAAEHARTGLARLPGWGPPVEVSDEAYRALLVEMTGIFEGALGYAALTDKDYAAAREHYQRAIAASGGGLQDDYQLAIAELEDEPADATGFWWAAKALSLAKGNDAAAVGISTYASAKYRSYHGASDGWRKIVTAAAAQDQPPQGFAASVTPAPKPEQSASR